MPATVISAANADHYKWGGAQGTDCDAWYLVKTPEINVIEELMPPGTAETPHHHVRARQFAFVMQGELTVMVEHHDFVVRVGEGIEIAPGQMHQAMNRSAQPVRFTMTSQPPSHDDRVEDGAPVPSGMPDDAVTALVLKVYRQMMAGKVDPALLTPAMNAQLTPEVAAGARMLFMQLGEPTKLTMTSHAPEGDGMAYVYTGTFTTGEFRVLISLDKAGRVSGYRLAP
jgi:mannose-6-phosphate isomerase-like protein (cupin superfamily)